jgi:UDP-N-acetyl-D-glucosamine dehydrogenase
VGQGYVGLSATCAAADAGFWVTGFDVDRDRITAFASGDLVVPGVHEDDFRAGYSSGRITFTTDSRDLRACQVILICVPTPLRDHAPDLSYVQRACRAIAKVLGPGRLVILESTTYPGTTEQLVRPILEKSGMRCGRDFLLAYSPERIDPGNQEYMFRSIPRVVGGMSPEGTGVASLFYAQLVDKVMSVSSCRAAELAKLLENTFRHVNIALVNEMSMLCHEVDIDIWEVIEAAATKPFGYMTFHPGPGVGGHCIPLDSGYLAWQVRRDAGHQFRILEQAQDINAQMPAYVASRIADALNDANKSVRGSRILVLGVTYKPDIGDMRESPSIKAMTILARRGAQVTFHDPFINSVSLNGTLLSRTELTQRCVETSDCVALLTSHRSYDLGWLADHAKLIFDARNAFDDDRRTNVVRL